VQFAKRGWLVADRRFKVKYESSILQLVSYTALLTVCISVLPAISRDLCRPRAVDICSVRNGAIMTRSNGAGPYPNAKQMIATNGVRTVSVGTRRRT